MTAGEVYKKLIHFIENEFAHSVARQDKDIATVRRIQIWTLISVIGGMAGIIGTLVALILGQ